MCIRDSIRDNRTQPPVPPQPKFKCSSAPKLLNELLTTDDYDVFLNDRRVGGLAADALTESCIYNTHLEYCRVAFPTMKYLTNHTFEGADDGYIYFESLYSSLKPHLINFTRNCLLENPHDNVKPWDTPYIWQGSEYCTILVNNFLRNLTDLLQTDDKKAIKSLNDFFKEISYPKCFNDNMTCLNARWTTQIFYEDTQNHSLSRQHNIPVLQYREGIIQYINLCYNNSNKTYPPRPQPQPNKTDNCYERATSLLGILRSDSPNKVFTNVFTIERLTRSVLNESCIASRNPDYCRVTFNTMRLVANETFSKAIGTFLNFQSLYLPFRFNLINWTEACVLGYPIYPSEKTTFREGIEFCRNRAEWIVSNVTELSQTSWLPAKAEILQNTLNHFGQSSPCFNQSLDCMNARWFTQMFYNDTQNANSFNEWRASIIQYRENVISFVNSCYNRTNGSQPIPSPNVTCASQLKDILKGVQQAIDTKREYSKLVLELRNYKPQISSFVNCIQSSPLPLSKICTSLTKNFNNIYLQALFATDLEEARSRTRVVIEDINDLFDVCELQPR
eukprot:TRINITY_DN6808_c0_g1_i1.p1 TRINITY_DN6808_c0_g1~~TRINITY_DN6808_c0_g1_i1.p1  ORF type:complete len:561 (+),score=96.71 TRINITY_DN6808_c0_g1_i1:67-1749(+)